MRELYRSFSYRRLSFITALLYASTVDRTKSRFYGVFAVHASPQTTARSFNSKVTVDRLMGDDRGGTGVLHCLGSGLAPK